MAAWVSSRRVRIVAVALFVTPLAVATGLYTCAGARARLSADEPWVALAPSGDGYTSYSWLGAALGRQYVRPAIAATLRDAFAALASRRPDAPHVLAETGWRNGGPFPPHQTHRDGSSVDILVPVLDSDGEPDTLSTAVWNLWGYLWRFDAAGRLQGLGWEGRTPCCALSLPTDLHVDFAALADLIVELEAQARGHGARLDRVIVTGDYRAALIAALPEPARHRLVPLLHTRPVWVRHDEHVHFDFDLP